MPFRAKSSTAAKRTEHSRKHSEIFQNSTFDLIDFVDFLLTRLHPSKNSLDTAIEELKNGEYQTYSSFDDFLGEIENEA